MAKDPLPDRLKRHAAFLRGLRYDEMPDDLCEAADRLSQRNALDALEKIHSWLVCSAIATPEDMAQSFSEMERIASEALDEASRETPIPMVLHCPYCHTQHIDAVDPATGWYNPPHRSHLCANCGAVWRPCDCATDGVPAIGSKGKHDRPPAAVTES